MSDKSPSQNKNNDASILTKTEVDKSQLRYLSQSVRLEEAVTPTIVRLTILVISASLVVFAIWASFTTIQEIARVQGEIIPKGANQVVQHLEGGIVEEIFVDDGYEVQKGDILLKLNPVSSSGDLERSMIKMIGLEMQQIRLDAIAKDIEPDFSAYERDHPDMVRDQMDVYKGRMASFEEEKKIIEDQIEQKKNAIDILNTQRQTAINNLEIIEELYQNRKTLKEKGVIAEVRYLETKQRLNELRGEVENIGNQIKAAEFSLSEFRTRLTSLHAKKRNDALQRMDTVMGELAQTRENVKKMEDRFIRLNIRSPIDGVVKGMSVNTIGSVIQPGELIMEIVPYDKELIAVVKIQPDDIGFVKIGDSVNVKVSTFDFSRFGSVEGELYFISATTFTDDDGSRFYEGHVKLQNPYVGNDPDNKILPGMTVLADIITGEKTIMGYLFKPITLSLKTAFTER